MDEMEQSFRIIEQALDKIPAGPVLLDTEGNVLPADEFRDEGKKGNIEEVRGKCARFDPTLEGGHKFNYPSIDVANKRVMLPAKKILTAY